MELLGSVGAIGTSTILIESGLVAGLGFAAWWIRGEDPLEPTEKDDCPAGWEATISLAMVLAASLLFAIPSLLLGREGRQRRPDLSPLLRGAMVEGRPTDPRGRPVRRERGDLLPRQRRPLVHLADGNLGRRHASPRSARLRSCSWPARRRTAAPHRSGSGRSAATIATCWFVSVHALVALLVRAERRHDLRGRLPAGGLFLPPLRAGEGGTAALVLGALAAGRGHGDQADRGRLRAAADRPGDRRLSDPARAVAGQIVAHRDRRSGPGADGRLLVRPRRLAHRQSALSPGGPRDGSHRLGRLVRTRRDA